MGFLGGSQSCHSEEVCCSLWIKPSFEAHKSFSGSKHRTSPDHCSVSFRCKNPLFGAANSHLLPIGHELSSSKVCVAADYSDSFPDASNYRRDSGYHPLEEIKDFNRRRDTVLTDAEIARTAVEANSSALLIFPAAVHREPHEHLSWAEFQYVIDDYGDMYFEIYDDENILQNRGASNLVNVLIGLNEAQVYGDNQRVLIENLDDIYSDSSYELDVEIDLDETGVFEFTGTDLGMPNTMLQVHPMYFAKCLTKAVYAKHAEKMDHPTNGLSIMGLLRPAFVDEESYLRRLFHSDDSDGYTSDGKDESEREDEKVASTYDLIDDGFLRFPSGEDGASMGSTLYKLEIISIQLHSIYGDQSGINLEDFQQAEPDILVHSASAIIERFNEYGMKCDVALKTLCRKKKGLKVEGANLINVDSLGMDVRVFSGVEAQTLRFSFNSQATSESSAEKKIRRMLFPRFYRKNPKPSNDGHRYLDSS
ncbi:hypothetical protein AMTR_s00066p00038410 [Amborella trichopoda]|uniref:Uncharacterized protein n=1 Tax=Amborella trichopoda TaxID=13333 RepID=U5DC60_AMBTC|nr:hypothetical protein AMTR_s00066p00038410 [Amborella trichopoda]